MSRDNDLITSCVCGCTEVIRKGGYATCSFSDAVVMGEAAGRLCRVSSKYPRVNALKRTWIWVLLLLITTSATFGVMEVERRQAETADALVRAGQSRIDAKDDLGAVEAFTKALEIRKEPRTYRFRSFAYWRLMDFEKCRNDLTCAGDNPECVSKLLSRGR